MFSRFSCRLAILGRSNCFIKKETVNLFSIRQRQYFCPRVSLLRSIECRSFPVILSRRFFAEQKNGNGIKPKPKPPPLTGEEINKLPLFQRFKYMFKTYWKIAIPIHFLNCGVWFCSFYALSSSGVDIVGILEKLHCPKKFLDLIKSYPSGGHLAITFAMYKIVTPLRYMVTLGLCHLAMKYFIRRGTLPPSAREISMRASTGIRKGAAEFRKRHADKKKNKSLKHKNGKHDKHD